MITLSKTIQTAKGILVPVGTPLEFKNGVAKYQGQPVERSRVPLQAIQGAKGPLSHVACAIIFNDIRGFQEIYKKRYQDWAHVVSWGDSLIIYVWDNREVIDLIGNMNKLAGGSKPRMQTLVSKQTGEKITKFVGQQNFGWAKKFYDMFTLPKYQRNDNGLPLVCKNKDWSKVVDDFNKHIETKYAYEAQDILI